MNQPDYKYAPKGDFSDNKFFAKQYLIFVNVNEKVSKY